MKPQPKNQPESASVLVVCVIITAIAGFLLLSYLGLVGSQNTSIVRSQVWNLGIPIAESGVEEALTHLNRNCDVSDDLDRQTLPRFTADSWQYTTGGVTKKRTLPDGSFFIATIILTNFSNPIIFSEGYPTRPPILAAQAGNIFAAVGVDGSSSQAIGRKIKVTATRTGLFTKGLVARKQIDTHGNNVSTDSFDSSNESFSTKGMYDPNKRRANGDVATVSGLTNSINVSLGNANIQGHVVTGPGGRMSIGPNGRVGDLDWGDSGVQPGSFRQDMNVDFQDVKAPFTGGFTPSGGNVAIVTPAELVATATNTSTTYPVGQSPVTTNYTMVTGPFPSAGTYLGTPAVKTNWATGSSFPSSGTYVGTVVTNYNYTTTSTTSSSYPKAGTYSGKVTTNNGKGGKTYTYNLITGTNYTYLYAEIIGYTYAQITGYSWYTTTTNSTSLTNYVYYDYVLDDGNYVTPSLSGTVYIRGNASLYVTGSTLDTQGIVVGPKGCLKLYTGAPSISLAGNGVLNQPGYATNFFLYGLSTCKNVTFSGNASFVGAVYCPTADLTLNGGGRDTTDFIGAGIFNNITINGHFNFHYDEALAKMGPSRGFVVNGWQEVPLR